MPKRASLLKIDPRNLSAALSAKGWDSRRLAREINVNSTTIWKWEKGAKHAPASDALMAACAALGVSPFFLFGMEITRDVIVNMLGEPLGAVVFRIMQLPRDWQMTIAIALAAGLDSGGPVRASTLPDVAPDLEAEMVSEPPTKTRKRRRVSSPPESR